MEKYSTSKNKNKLTYVIIPDNHPTFKFPYNLEDRVKWIIDKIKEKIKFKIDINIRNIPIKINNENVVEYDIMISNNSNLDDFRPFLEDLGAELLKDKNAYKIEVK